MSRQENHKAVGEKGVLCVLAEFAKHDIPVSVPLSDNLPYDFVADVSDRLFRIQVKSSSYGTNAGSVEFSLSTNNWHSKTVKKYTNSDCDVMACYDLSGDNVYLLSPDQFVNRKTFTIRKEPTKNKQTSRCNFHDDFVMNHKRITEVFT